MTPKAFLLMLLTPLFALSSLAEAPPSVRFAKAIDGFSIELAADYEGNCAVLFCSLGQEPHVLALDSGSLTGSVLVAKCNRLGEWLWQKRFQESNAFGVLAVDLSGNTIVATYGLTNHAWVSVAGKYDKDGKLLWQKRVLDGHYFQEVRSVVTDSSGNIFAAIQYSDQDVVSYPQTNYSAIVALAPDGSPRWTKWKTNSVYLKISATATDDIYAVTSSSTSTEALEKYSNAGVLQWTLSSSYISEIIAPAANDSCWTTTAVPRGAGNLVDCTLANVGRASISQFTLTNQTVHDIVIDKNGSVFVAGGLNIPVRQPDGHTVEIPDIRISCFEPTGVLKWQQTFGGPGDDEATRISISPLGNIFVSGAFSETVQFGSTVLTVPPPKSKYFLLMLADSPIVPPPPDLPVQVTTIAGSGVQGYLDSTDPLQAQFNHPDSGVVTKEGTIFIPDTGNNVIRYILPSGEVGTWAGTPGVSGYRDGVGTNALFNGPIGLTLDSFGDLLVADYFGHRLRKVLGSGYRSVSLLAGRDTPGLADGYFNVALLNAPNDLVQFAGQIYFTDFANHTVRRLDANGFVYTIAGNGAPGYKDGQGTAAQFNGPAGITTFGGSLYVSDWNNNRIRKVTPAGVVTTIAGNGTAGLQSGLGTNAVLYAPNGITADSAGNLYFTEHWNNDIRRLDTNGWVSTLAGTGAAGYADGDRTQALFTQPAGLTFHPDGSLIVMDTGNNRIRRIIIDGKTNTWTRSEGFLTADLHPTLKIYGNVGERYRIESRGAFGQGDWSAIASVIIDHSPQIWVDDRPDPGQQRIYRAVKE